MSKGELMDTLNKKVEVVQEERTRNESLFAQWKELGLIQNRITNEFRYLFETTDPRTMESQQIATPKRSILGLVVGAWRQPYRGMDHTMSHQDTLRIVLERDVERPGLRKGAIVAVVQSAKDEVYPFTQTITGRTSIPYPISTNFVVDFSFCSYGRDGRTLDFLMGQNIPLRTDTYYKQWATDNHSLLVGADGRIAKEHGIVGHGKENREKSLKCARGYYETAESRVRNTFTMLVEAAKDPELNPEIADRVRQAYAQRMPFAEAS